MGKIQGAHIMQPGQTNKASRLATTIALLGETYEPYLKLEKKTGILVAYSLGRLTRTYAVFEDTQMLVVVLLAEAEILH